jgi:AraC family transcriptional activator of pobA
MLNMHTPSTTFFLYGEPPRPADRHFLHLEPLDDRSRAANWNIKPHRHDELHQIFLLTGGAGEMHAQNESRSVTAPCLILVPARTAHAFSFKPETTGRVLTLSDAFLSDLRRMDDSLGALLFKPMIIHAGTATNELLGLFDRLRFELAWYAPGHAAAVKASLLQILVTILRLEYQNTAQSVLRNGDDARLIAGFREQVEARFRSHVLISIYASALGVSVSRLRIACRTQACGTPVDIVNARRMREAQNALLYSHASVTEIAFSLGYDDVSYFIRLFRRREGVSPHKFRRAELIGAEAPQLRLRTDNNS